MFDAGLFTGRRVQLIRGSIVEMSPMKSPHAVVVEKLTRLLVSKLGVRWSVRPALPLETASDSVPEPDFAVTTRQEVQSALPAHPRTARLVIEVSDATLLFDREEKLPVYAAAGVPEYVIANTRKKQLEIFTRPIAGSSAVYGSREVLSGAQAFRSKAVPGLVLRVKDVFAACP